MPRNPFLVICQYMDKFIISFFHSIFLFFFPFFSSSRSIEASYVSFFFGVPVEATTGNNKKKPAHRFQFKQFHTILNAYLSAYGPKIGKFFPLSFFYSENSSLFGSWNFAWGLKSPMHQHDDKIFNNLSISSYHFHALCLLILMPYHLYFLCPGTFFLVVRTRTLFTSKVLQPDILQSNELEKCYFSSCVCVCVFLRMYSQFIVEWKNGTISTSFMRPNLLIILMPKCSLCSLQQKHSLHFFIRNTFSNGIWFFFLLMYFS